MPAEVFLSALAERRVRFFESPALDQFGVVRYAAACMARPLDI
jgi:hypothetical protein